MKNLEYIAYGFLIGVILKFHELIAEKLGYGEVVKEWNDMTLKISLGILFFVYLLLVLYGIKHKKKTHELVKDLFKLNKN